MNAVVVAGSVMLFAAWMRIPLTWQHGTIRGDKQAAAVFALGLALFVVGYSL